MKRAARLLAASGAAMLASACAHAPWNVPAPQIRSDHSKVPGILEHASAAGKKRIVVFSTHGMGATERCYADTIVEMFTRKALNGGKLTCVTANGGGRPRASVMPVCLGRDYHVTGEGLASGEEVHLGAECSSAQTPPHMSGGGERAGRATRFSRFGQLLRQDVTTSYKGRLMPVTIFSYFWNDDAWWLQQPYVGHDLRFPGRTWGNGYLKKKVINFGFSDATLYTGNFGEVMRTGTQNALCLMLLESEPDHRQAGTSHSHSAPCALVGAGTKSGIAALEPAQMVYLTESLGSRLLFDSLQETATLRSGEAEAVRALAAQIVGSDPIVYMSANQLPLLGLARLKVEEGNGTAKLAEPQRSFLRDFLVSSAPLTGHPHEIVAFHDPNDLLGYEASAHLQPPLADRIIEVTQHYARPFWIGALPLAAHNQSFRHRVSRRMILCGATRRPGGALSIPKRCD